MIMIFIIPSDIILFLQPNWQANWAILRSHITCMCNMFVHLGFLVYANNASLSKVHED